MPLPSWPSGVPYQVRRDEWEMADSFRPPIETEMDGGNLRACRRPGDDVAVIRQTIRMTPAQADTLFAFIRDDLVNGTGRFTMNVWLGTTYQERLVQFVGPRPSKRPAGLRIAVPMTLRVEGGG
jgi:hypothetical protein